MGSTDHANAPFVWNCRLENFRVLATADAEQTAIVNLIKDGIAYRRLATELGFKPSSKLFQIYSDNQPMINRLKNPIRARCKQHTKLRLNYVYEHCADHSDEKSFTLSHIPGKENPADLWTKCQPADSDFYFCRKYVLNLDVLKPPYPQA